MSMVKISISFKLMSPIKPTYYMWLRYYFRKFTFLRETNNKRPSTDFNRMAWCINTALKL